MKGKNEERRPPLPSPIVEDGAAEGLKKRLRDLGLIVNAAGGGKPAEPAGKKKGEKR